MSKSCFIHYNSLRYTQIVGLMCRLKYETSFRIRKYV